MGTMKPNTAFFLNLAANMSLLISTFGIGATGWQLIAGRPDYAIFFFIVTVFFDLVALAMVYNYADSNPD